MKSRRGTRAADPVARRLGYRAREPGYPHQCSRSDDCCAAGNAAGTRTGVDLCKPWRQGDDCGEAAEREGQWPARWPTFLARRDRRSPQGGGKYGGAGYCARRQSARPVPQTGWDESRPGPGRRASQPIPSAVRAPGSTGAVEAGGLSRPGHLRRVSRQQSTLGPESVCAALQFQNAELDAEISLMVAAVSAMRSIGRLKRSSA